MQIYKIFLFLPIFIHLASSIGEIAGYHYRFTNHKLAADIYKKLSVQEKGSFLFSPYSVQYLLYLLQIGANGKTCDEISSLISVDSTTESLPSISQYLLDSLKQIDKEKLNIINRIYVDTGSLTDYYLNASSTFRTDFRYIYNFTKIPSEMNEWLALHSGNRIQSKTELYFTNIVSFKANWKIPFLRKQVAGNSDYNEILVVTNEFFYLDDDILNCHFIELPFDNDNVAMTIIWPKDKKNGFSVLENHVKYIIDIHLTEKKRASVNIPSNFPKASGVSLRSVLQSLDVKLAFSDYADFTNISKVPLKIANILQKTVIEIDKKTINIQSAIINEVKKIKRYVPRPEFTADSSFLYYLKHKILGVLFIGRFVPV